MRSLLLAAHAAVSALRSLADAISDRARWRALRPSHRCRLLAGAAAGLAHMHAHGAYHGDVKSHNILLTDRRRTSTAAAAAAAAAAAGPANRDVEAVAQICDLGSARFVGTSAQGAAAAAAAAGAEGDVGGTAGYASPEVLAGGAPTAEGDALGWASDVWSFGVVLWEAMADLSAAAAAAATGGEEAAAAARCIIPSNGFAAVTAEKALERLRAGERLPIPCDDAASEEAVLPPMFGRLLRQCWELEPQRRPRMQQVADIVSKSSFCSW